MPGYEYRCAQGHDKLVFCTVAAMRQTEECQYCGQEMGRVITAPILVKAAADVCYDSPIDGRPITSWQARQEDLKRNGCREYDPEMKTDQARRLKDSEAALDRTVDEAVESAIERMPTAKRGQLYSELTEQGVTADVIRTTPTA